MRILYDHYGRIEPSRAYLAKPDKTILCALNSIDVHSVNFTGNGNDLSSISFNIEQHVETEDKLVEANGYELVSKNMKLDISNVGWFIMDTPTIHHTGNREYKTINAYSAQKEYGQVPLDQWKVNRGTTDSLEMLVDGNVEEIEGVEFAKENIKFQHESNPELSLVDILVSKVPGWKVGYVDPIPKVYETYDNGELVTTSVKLADEVGTFDVDYSDAYSFMVQDFEKYFNCIVEFDYLNLEVNFYRVENYGEDTNVTIGFRNVENTNDVTVDEDNIFTKFRVTGGDDLGIEQVNGGSNYLIYLSDYFLNEKYLSASTIEKYKKWSAFCDSARYTYADYSRQWNTLQDEITGLNDRMPVSDCNPENWQNLSDEELLSLKADYEAQKLGYEKIYVDDEGNFDMDLLNASPDANIYHQIADTILPNIQIEIDNRDLPTSEGEEDYLEAYETNWDYYGVNELTVKLQSYQDIVNLLKKSHYDLTWERYQELSQSDPDKYPVLTESGFEDKHEEYEKNALQLDENHIDSCAYALKQRKEEVTEKESEQTSVNESRSALAKNMDMNTWTGIEEVDGKAVPANVFTTKELSEINHLLNQSTYTNENIFVSSVDGLSDTVTIQQKLCETALDDIAVYAVPQTIYATTMDNILAASGNELHAHDIDYGNFIRLGIRDDYYVKLRVSQMSYNPFLYDNNFTISFSNMVKSGKTRHDFISLLNMSNNLSNASASNSYSSSFQITDENIYQVLQRLLQSSSFNNKVQNIINNSSDNYNDYLVAGDIYGNNGFFQYIQAELIAVGKIVADSAEFNDLSALVAKINNLLAGNVSAELGHLIELTAQNVRIDEAVIKDLIASQITVSMLKAGEISSDQFNIVSDDGSMTIVGNTMQFKDSNDIVRIQLGKDETGNFTFVLYDETGKGVLIDSEGIKESAIEDGLIKTDMVADGAITESKIDKTGMLEWTDEEGNKIFQIGKMYFGDEKFEVSYNQTIEKVNQTYEKVKDLANRIGSISIMGDQIFKEVQGVMTPASITLRAVCRNNVEVGKWYIDDVENTEYISEDGMSITIPSSFMSKRDSAVVKVTDSLGDLYDIMTIYRISDSEGVAGQAAISIIITSDKGTAFNDKTTIKSTVCTCTVYEGVQEITPNSYGWMMAKNDESTWTTIGTSKQITIDIDPTVIRKRIRCDVDIDI